MGLTSEQAHWIVGAELCALALTLLLYELQVWPARGLRYALGATLLVLAAEGVLFPATEGALTPERLDATTAQHPLPATLAPAVGPGALSPTSSSLRRHKRRRASRSYAWGCARASSRRSK